MRRGVIQVDEHDVRILIVDHIREPGAVRKLDGVDILSPQLLRQVLAEDKILVDDETQRTDFLGLLSSAVTTGTSVMIGLNWRWLTNPEN